MVPEEEEGYREWSGRFCDICGSSDIYGWRMILAVSASYHHHLFLFSKQIYSLTFCLEFMRNRQSIKQIRNFCFFFFGPGRVMLRPHSEGEVCRKRFSFVSAQKEYGFFLFGLFNQICFEMFWRIFFASIYSIP